jgi:membrane protease subunit HflC
VQIIEDRVMRFDLDNIRVQVSGGKFYEVDAFVAYRIDDPRVSAQAVSGSVATGRAAAADPSRRGAAPRLRSARLRGGAVGRARLDDARGARPASARRGTSLGLEIEDVRIRRTDLTAEVSQQTFDRMKAERLAEAERLRARGREAAQRIRARADREVVEIVAEARANRRSCEARAKPNATRSSPTPSSAIRSSSSSIAR